MDADNNNNIYLICYCGLRLDSIVDCRCKGVNPLPQDKTLPGNHETRNFCQQIYVILCIVGESMKYWLPIRGAAMHDYESIAAAQQAASI